MSSLGKGWGPSFEQTGFPFTQVWLKSREIEMKMWKSYRQTGGPRTTGDQKSSLSFQLSQTKWEIHLRLKLKVVYFTLTMVNF